MQRSRREVPQHRVRVDDRGQHDDAVGVQPAAVRRHGHAQPVRKHHRQPGRRSGRRLVVTRMVTISFGISPLFFDNHCIPLKSMIV